MDGNLGWFTGHGAEWADSTGSLFAHYHAKYAKLDASGTTAPLFAPQIISRSLGLILFFRRPPAAACNLRFSRARFQCRYVKNTDGQTPRADAISNANQLDSLVAAAVTNAAARPQRQWHAERGRSKRCLDASIRGASTSVRPSTHNPSPVPSPRKSIAEDNDRGQHSRADGAGF